jgi:nicotinamide riboside transporter PnuC
MLAGAAALLFLGVAVGAWIALIGGAIGIICLVGWTYEYHRGYFGH